MDDGTGLMTPPPELNFTGKGDFHSIGQQLAKCLIEDGGLRPNHRVLDVGCGIGRIALSLIDYLAPAGSYEGMDIVDVGIDWCRKNIASTHPRFRFSHSDVYNQAYHPAGRFAARDYRFPFRDGEFDFVILTSVFTHMLPADLENYFSEIARVMKVGGVSAITYLLRNAESLRCCAAGKASMTFPHQLRGCWAADAKVPEDAIAFDEPYIIGLYERYGFQLLGPVRYGSWSGRAGGYSGQDFIFAMKARESPAPFAQRFVRSMRRGISRCLPRRRRMPMGSAGHAVTTARQFAGQAERAA